MGINQVTPFGQAPANRSLTLQQNAGAVAQVQTYGGAQSIALAPGQVFLLPGGNLIVTPGPYTDVQYFDANSQIWRNLIGTGSQFVASDGTNYRFANLSGCPVGAVITTPVTTAVSTVPVAMVTPTGTWIGGVFTAQSGSSLPFTIVASAGGSTWNAFIGGMLGTTPVITAGGTGYTLAPELVAVPPANQGSQPFVPATLTCTVSGGAINAVTVLNQGAGYVSPPTILVVNAPGDTTGSGGIITAQTSAAATGAGLISLIVMATPGTAVTAVPTFTLTSGTYTLTGLAATVIMNFSVTAGGTVTNAGTYVGGYSLQAINTSVVTAPTYRNPAYEKGSVLPVQPVINGLAGATAVVTVPAATAAGGAIFGGFGFQIAPSLIGVGFNTAVGNIATAIVGGYADASLVYPI